MLSRKLGEKVMIGDDVCVVVLGHHGGQVSLGIEAPDEVPVHRREIWERIRAGKLPPRRRRGFEGGLPA